MFRHIEQPNLSRKKLHRNNQGSNLLGSIFNYRYKANLEEKDNLIILKDDFSLRTDPSIFTPVVPVLLDISNKTGFSCVEIDNSNYFEKAK